MHTCLRGRSEGQSEGCAPAGPAPKPNLHRGNPMTVLILGLVLFIGVHSVGISRPHLA